jgi:hypothetical protein
MQVLKLIYLIGLILMTHGHGIVIMNTAGIFRRSIGFAAEVEQQSFLLRKQQEPFFTIGSTIRNTNSN